MEKRVPKLEISYRPASLVGSIDFESIVEVVMNAQKVENRNTSVAVVSKMSLQCARSKPISFHVSYRL